MKFKVTSINTKYADRELVDVRVNYSATNNDRSININGVFVLTAEEYEGNEMIEVLEGKAKNHLLLEVNAE